MRKRLAQLVVIAACAALLGCASEVAEDDAQDTVDAGESPRRRIGGGEPNAMTPDAAAPDVDAAIDDGATDTGTADDATPLPCAVWGVLRDNCIRCHAQPPLMGAPFPLLTWEDLDMPWGMDVKVRDVALQRVTSIGADRMPPRPADPLGTAQIDALARWLQDGAPAGDNPSCRGR